MEEGSLEEHARLLETAVEESLPEEVKLAAHKEMQSILSSVHGSQSAVWQFPLDRSKEIARRKAEVRYRKSRSRSKSPSRGRTSKSRSRSRGKSGVRPRRRLQTGGALVQRGGWKWFGWFRSDAAESSSPAPTNAATNDEAKYKGITERLLTSSVFQAAIAAAVNLYAYRTVVSDDFVNTVYLQVRQKMAEEKMAWFLGPYNAVRPVHTLSELARSNYLNMEIFKEQAMYLMAVMAMTAAVALVVREVLKRYYPDKIKPEANQSESNR